MKLRSAVLFLFLFLSANALRAELPCPWLTQGTAAAMLGGDVDAAIKLVSSDQGSCVFSLRQGATTYLLKIVVERNPQLACPPASTRLSGIGNEAVACKLQPAPSETEERVIGRVRALYFTVSLTINGIASPSQLAGKPKDIAERAAEQVAGSLD